MGVLVSVEDRENWMDLCMKFKRAGFMNDIPESELDLDEDVFPIEFEVSLDPILNLVDHPMVRPFRKKLDEGITSCVRGVTG